MIIKTISFYIILVLSLISISGYGILYSNVIKEKVNSDNIFNYFFKGLILITILSVLYHFLIQNNKIINVSIFLIGIG